MTGTSSIWTKLGVGRSRALRVLIIGLCVLALLVVSVVTLISVPAGRAFIASQALDYANAALDQRITVGDVDGSWSSHFILLDISVADDEGEWLTADRLEMQVQVSALFRGHLHLNNLAINAVHVMRLPAGSDTESAESESLALPTAADIHDALGGITVEAASIQSLRLDEPVLGQQTEVKAMSSLLPESGRGGVVLSLELQRRDAPGTAKLSLNSAPREAALAISGNVAGFNAEGALAVQSRNALSGALNFSCRSEPCFAWSTGAIRSGSVQLKLNGTSQAPVAEIGFSMTDLNEDVRRLSELSGQINVTPVQGQSGIFGIEASGRLRGTPSAVPEIAEIVGDESRWSVNATIQEEIARLREARLTSGDTVLTVSGDVTSSGASPASIELNVHGGGRLMDIAEDQSDVRMTFNAEHINGIDDLRGHLAVNITNALRSPPLLDGTMRAEADIVADGARLSLTKLAATAGALNVMGSSAWQDSGAGFDHTSSALTVRVAAKGLSSVLPQATRAEISLSGPLEALKAKVQGTTAEIALGSLSFTEVSLAADLARDGDTLTGALDGSGQWLDGPFSLSTNDFQIGESGAALHTLEFAGGNGDVRGDLTIGPDGDLGGEFSGRFTDLLPLTAALGFEVAGAADVTSQLTSANGAQSAVLNLETGFISTSVFDADALAGQITFNDLFAAPRLESDVTVTGFTAMGRFAQTVTASAAGSFDDIHVELTAPAAGLQSLGLDASADINVSDVTLVVLQTFSAQDGSHQVSLKRPARLTVADSEILLEPMTVNFAGGAIDANFRWDKQADTVTGALIADGLSSGILMKDLQGGIPGTISADVSLSGPAQSVVIEAMLGGRFPAPVGTGAQPVDVDLQASVREGQAVISGTATGLSGEPGKLSARFPMQVDLVAGRLQVDVDAPASGSVVWNGEVAPLWRLLPVDNHILDGSIRMDVALAGSLAAPQITGGLSLTEGSYEFIPGGTVLKNLSAEITAENADAFDFTLEATGSDRGTVNASGRIGRKGAEASWAADIAAELDRLILVNRDDVTVGATGRVAYAGPILSGTLSGELQIVRSAVRLDASYEPEIPLLRKPPGTGAFAQNDSSPIRLDVTLNIDELLRAEGRGLESVWRGRLHVGGDISHPDLAGSITLDRGTFSFIGQTFALDSGTVTFTGGGRVDPELAITAVRQAEDITATVFISGRASKPNITLSSRPPLPQDEVLARLLFRKGSGQLGPLESVQLASAAAELSGLSEGGLNGVLRRTFGFDVVSIGGEDGDSLVVGEQVGRNIYVAVEQNLTDNSRKFIVEWRFSPSFSLQSTASDETGADLGVLWRRDY